MPWRSSGRRALLRGRWRWLLGALGLALSIAAWMIVGNPWRSGQRHAWPPPSYALPAAYFRHVNLEYPGLERVKQAVRLGDYDRAVDEYLVWREQGQNRPLFFFDIAEPAFKDELRARYAGDLGESTTRAQSFLRNEFPYQNHLYRLSDPPNYFPKRPWRVLARASRFFGIDLAAARALEDILVNSFGEWTRHLGAAYAGTGNEKFALKFCYYFRTWVEAAAPLPEPYIAGDVTHPQAYSLFTVAARTNSWLRGYYFFRDVACFDTVMRFRVLYEIVEQLKYVHASLTDAITGAGSAVNWEFWRQRHNPPLITASRQVTGVLMFPELQQSSVMLDNALQMVGYYLSHHLTAEGHQPERDSAYHMGSFVYSVEFLLLARMNRVALPESIIQGLEKTFEVLLSIVQPSGYLPAVGDTPLMLDPSGYFALGATVYRRADFTCLAAEHVDFDTYLVLYRFRNQQTDREPACRQPYLESVALPATGFYVMRSGGGWASTRVDGPDYDETLYLFFDAAPAYGHTHYDALNIIVAGYGSKPPYNLLDESGAAHNWSINPLTHYYSRSRAHNVVVIDDQLTPSGVNDPPPTVHRWYTSASLDFVSGSYGGPYEGNMVTRNILFVKGEYWILRDEILGKGTHVLEQLFNFVPVVRRTEQGEVMRQADLTVNTARQSVVPNYDGPRLLLMPADPAQLGLELKEGWKWHPTFAALREDVGQFLDVRAPTVSYMKKVDTTVPTAFETILFPLHKGEEREIAVERLRVTDAGVGSAEASGLRIAIGASNLHNRTWSKRAAKVDYYVRSVRSIHVTFGETISLLGSYGLIRSHQEGEPFVMCILDGQELAYASYRVRLEKRGAACVEQDSDGGYVVEASDTVQLTLPTREQGPHARKRARYRRLNGPWTESLVAEESNEASLSLRVPGGGRFELLMQ